MERSTRRDRKSALTLRQRKSGKFYTGSEDVMKEGLIMSKVEVLNESSFDELVLMIESARNRAWQAVNAELVTLYWNVGKWLSEKLSEATWGSKVVENASEYLSMKRPDLGSFTKRTLYRMVEFYKTYKDDEFVTPLVTQITWTNHLIILLRAKSPEERRFYIEKCAAEHCSKRNLERLFDSSFYERRRIGEVAPASALVVQPARLAVPDMYSLEFLDLPERYREANLRDAIVLHLRDFILELGKDFTFVGKEYPVKVGNSDFSIDLLFFNRALRCFFAFELKTRKFRPADIGQIDFYLEALDRDVKKPDENPSVGVILCTDKDDSVVEYALSRSMSPTMVASYQLALPDKDILQNRLRQITELVLEENQIAELPCFEDKDEVS